MAAPDAIINNDKLYIQHIGAGDAQGHPDVTLAFYLDIGENIHFYEYTATTATWAEGQSGPYTWVGDKDQLGDGTVHYDGKNGSPDVIIVKSQGILYSNMLGQMATTLGEDRNETNFYASNIIIGGSAPLTVLNGRKVKPFATETGAVKSAKTNGAPLAGSSGGYTPGGSTSGGSTPGGSSGGTTGTSQSTMYVIGGGALIGLLFLFTQKK